MLVATPYREFVGPPRVISEVRKNYASNNLIDFRPKLAGDLLVRTGNEKKWWPRRSIVKNGQLQISGVDKETPALRLPLRHLSLQAGALPNSLSLCKGQSVVLTIQTANERLFEIWVKTIAIELIRQTPLEDVKYLDIFTLASCWGRKTPKDCNSNYIEPTTEPQCEVCITNNNNNEPITEEKNIENLLKKCQNSESYVPVKEKLILFESLCKLGRKVRSTEDVSCKTEKGTKRARSMHDLSNFNPNSAVREICKYFEIKSEASVDKYGTIARFNRSDSQLNSVKKPF